MRLFALICLIVLASIGVGISGGVPLPSFSKRIESETENIELIDEQDENTASKESAYKR